MKRILIYLIFCAFVLTQHRTTVFFSINKTITSGKDLAWAEGKTGYEIGAIIDFRRRKHSGFAFNISYEKKKIDTKSRTSGLTQNFSFISLKPMYRVGFEKFLEFGPVASFLIKESSGSPGKNGPVSKRTITADDVTLSLYTGLGLRVERLLVIFGFNAALTNHFREGTVLDGKLHSMKIILGFSIN